MAPSIPHGPVPGNIHVPRTGVWRSPPSLALLPPPASGGEQGQIPGPLAGTTQGATPTGFDICAVGSYDSWKGSGLCVWRRPSIPFGSALRASVLGAPVRRVGTRSLASAPAGVYGREPSMAEIFSTKRSSLQEITDLQRPANAALPSSPMTRCSSFSSMANPKWWRATRSLHLCRWQRMRRVGLEPRGVRSRRLDARVAGPSLGRRPQSKANGGCVLTRTQPPFTAVPERANTFSVRRYGAGKYWFTKSCASAVSIRNW